MLFNNYLRRVCYKNNNYFIGSKYVCVYIKNIILYIDSYLFCYNKIFYNILDVLFIFFRVEFCLFYNVLIKIF